MNNSKKYLIFCLGANGDCLFTTNIAVQIKYENENNHITWLISKKYKSILSNNPFIDSIIELDPGQLSPLEFYQYSKEQIKSSNFDCIIDAHIYPQNYKLFFSTIRNTILKIFGKEITVPKIPVLQLYPHEINNVTEFVKRHKLTSYKNIILFECAPTSSQSKINITRALEISKEVIAQVNNTCFIITSPNKIVTTYEHIFDASELTIRENAELINYCNLLIGCSSGISWLSTSSWCKKINTLQLLNFKFKLFTGMKYDFQLNQMENGHIIEIGTINQKKVANCVIQILKYGFHSASKNYKSAYKINYYNYAHYISVLIHNKVKLNSIIKLSDEFKIENPYLNNFILRLIIIYKYCTILILKYTTSFRI